MYWKKGYPKSSTSSQFVKAQLSIFTAVVLAGHASYTRPGYPCLHDTVTSGYRMPTVPVCVRQIGPILIFPTSAVVMPFDETWNAIVRVKTRR